MSGIPNYYAITIHVRHQQKALLAEVNRERRATEAEGRTRGHRLVASQFAVAALVLLLAVNAAAA